MASPNAGNPDVPHRHGHTVFTCRIRNVPYLMFHESGSIPGSGCGEYINLTLDETGISQKRIAEVSPKDRLFHGALYHKSNFSC